MKGRGIFVCAWVEPFLAPEITRTVAYRIPEPPKSRGFFWGGGAIHLSPEGSLRL